MNNDFEKNSENLNNNDNASEIINEQDNSVLEHEEPVSDEVTSSVNTTPKNCFEEPSFPEDTTFNSMLETPFQQTAKPNVESANVSQPAPNSFVSSENSNYSANNVNNIPNYTPPQSAEKVNNIPGSGAYVYGKTPENNASVVGYVWDNSANKDKEKKKKSGSSGFKVFTAAMLGVFTLSSVTIAGFLMADYIRDNAAPAVPKKPESLVDIVNKYQPHVDSQSTSNEVTPVSSFTDVEGGLTKSQVAEKCQPSAVGIVVEQEQNYNGYTFPFDFGYGFGGGYPGGTQIIEGSGSGFIFSADGYIITNHHVVDGATKITVYLHDGSIAEASLIGSDALSDIAVIKIDSSDRTLIPMEIGDSGLMKVGDEVIAIGCPAGIEFMGTVTDGIISAINRDVELDNEGSMSSSTKTMTLLQTNATINRGNSGGPLINTLGQVIGINTLKLSSDYEGIGFSIPINGALPIINQLIEHGEVIERTESFVSSEGVIGISASEITRGDSEYYDIPMGIMVVQINKDSSAAKAGLKRGDIITKFNGESVTTVNELNRLKSNFKAGDEVTLTVYRELDGSDDTFDITFKLDMAT